MNIQERMAEERLQNGIDAGRNLTAIEEMYSDAIVLESMVSTMINSAHDIVERFIAKHGDVIETDQLAGAVEEYRVELQKRAIALLKNAKDKAGYL